MHDQESIKRRLTVPMDEDGIVIDALETLLDHHADAARDLYNNKMEVLADALTHHAGEHIRIAFPLTPTNQLEEGARPIAIACKRVKSNMGAS